jgi:hypothetical protein
MLRAALNIREAARLHNHALGCAIEYAILIIDFPRVGKLGGIIAENAIGDDSR